MASLQRVLPQPRNNLGSWDYELQSQAIFRFDSHRENDFVAKVPCELV